MRRVKKFLQDPIKLLKPSLLLAFLALFLGPFLSDAEWNQEVKDEKVVCPNATFSLPGKKTCSELQFKVPFTSEALPAMEYKTDDGDVAMITKLPYGTHAWKSELMLKEIAHSLSDSYEITHWESSGTTQVPTLVFTLKKDGKLKSYGIAKAEDTLIKFSAEGVDSLSRVKTRINTVSLSTS